MWPRYPSPPTPAASQVHCAESDALSACCGPVTRGSPESRERITWCGEPKAQEGQPGASWGRRDLCVALKEEEAGEESCRLAFVLEEGELWNAVGSHLRTDGGN